MPNYEDILLKQIQEAKGVLAKEMPDVAGTDIHPMGTFDRLLSALKARAVGGNQIDAITRGRSIAYNPQELLGRSQDQINDMLAHELTHVRQGQRPSEGVLATIMSLIHQEPYGRQSSELEAFQTESDRAAREHRVPDPQPSFTGTPRRYEDILLQAGERGK